MKKLPLIFRYLFLALFLCLLAGYVIVFNNRAGWVLLTFYLLLIFADLLSLLCSLKKVQVTAPPQIVSHQGDQVPLTLGISSSKKVFFPLLEISLAADDGAVYQASSYRGQRVVCRFDLGPRKRGVYSALSVQLQQFDWFNLFTRQQKRQLPTEWLVLPAEKHQAADFAKEIQQQLRRQAYGEPQYTIKGYRAYQSGDPLKWIDWKISARQQAPILRQWEHLEEVQTVLLFWGEADAQFEAALSFFYSLQKTVGQDRKWQILLLDRHGPHENSLRAFAELTPFEENAPAVPPFANRHFIVVAPALSEHLQQQVKQWEKRNRVTVYDFSQFPKNLTKTSETGGVADD